MPTFTFGNQVVAQNPAHRPTGVLLIQPPAPPPPPATPTGTLPQPLFGVAHVQPEPDAVTTPGQKAAYDTIMALKRGVDVFTDAAKVTFGAAAKAGGALFPRGQAIREFKVIEQGVETIQAQPDVQAGVPRVSIPVPTDVFKRDIGRYSDAALQKILDQERQLWNALPYPQNVGSPARFARENDRMATIGANLRAARDELDRRRRDRIRKAFAKIKTGVPGSVGPDGLQLLGPDVEPIPDP